MDISQFDGNSWEIYSHKLLKLKFYHEYTVVPDRFYGDCGIEGYTYSGDAYQFYCPDENLTAKELYEHQRDKITRDLNKLRIHERELIKILGNIVIKNWIFLTPEYNHRNIIAHIRRKEEEVLNFNLSFIDNDFRVKILDYNYFLREIGILEKYKAVEIAMDEVDLKKEELDSWKKNHNNYYLKMFGKLKKVYKNDKKAKQMVEKYLKSYLIGLNYLDQILADFPDIHERILIEKNSMEVELKIFGNSEETQGSQFLKNSFSKYEEGIKNKCSIRSDQLRYIAFEAMGEWLYNCTIDF